MTTATKPELTQFFAPITYMTKGASADPANSRFVYGRVSDSSIDIDLQRADPEWLKSALSEWWEWRNIQANHNGPDVGVGIELSKSADGDGWDLISEIVDESAITKLDKGVFKAYSIGIRWPKLAFKSANAADYAPGGTIVGGKIVHVALCGRPSNATTRIAVGKSPNAEDFVLAKSAFADVPETVETEAEAEEIVKAASDGKGDDAPSGDHAPMNGTHTHAHPAFGKSGDDKTHLHSHDHANNADHNHHAGDTADKAAASEKKGAPKSPPEGYPKDSSAYADPKNFKYPLDTPGRITSAIAYFNKNAGANKSAGDYSTSEWKTIGNRIVAAANKRFDGGYSLGSDLQIETPKSSKKQSNKAAETADSEMTDAEIANQAIGLIKQLIAREAAEAVEDEDDDDINDVYKLVGALDALRWFVSGEVNEAAMLMTATGGMGIEGVKSAFAELWKSGARNSASDQQIIQTIHDHAGALGAGASDACGAGGDMDEKAARALVAEEVGKLAPKAVEDWLTAAGVTPELVKSAVAKPDVEELVKGALTPLDERLTAVENRAEEGGPLILAVERGIQANRITAEKSALADEVKAEWHRAQTHQDPRVRAEATFNYSKLRARLEAME
jgi:hypothetical protein